jgi:hypothetical protein
MIVLSILAALVVFPALNEMALATPRAPQAREGVVELKSQAAPAAKGQDPNIETDRGTNSPSTTEPAPPTKGGPRPRGLFSKVHIDNHTSWYVDIYLDSRYRGTVPPWGDLYREVISGTTRFYARASFDDGSVRTWGPFARDIEGAWTIRLH